MRIQEASSIFNGDLGESVPSERFREGSTHRSMSAIRINVEEASNDGREDFVRNVSPITTCGSLNSNNNRCSNVFYFADDL